MKQPTNNNQEILYHLIKYGAVDIFDFPYLSGFRTRVSNLKLNYGVEMFEMNKYHTNKFGRKITYVRHYLSDKEKAIEIYNNMTKTSHL